MPIQRSEKKSALGDPFVVVYSFIVIFISLQELLIVPLLLK